MSCVSPILVKTKTGVVNASCGRCLSCCVAKQSALNFLCEKELQKVYSRGLGASFCTLTYNDDNAGDQTCRHTHHKPKTLFQANLDDVHNHAIF